MRPLTANEVYKSLPTVYPKTKEPFMEERFAKRAFGKKFKQLMPRMLPALMGIEVQALIGIDWGEATHSHDDEPTIGMTKGERMNLIETIVPLSVDEFGDLTYKGKWGEYGAYLDDNGKYVTGSGSDPIFVFVETRDRRRSKLK